MRNSALGSKMALIWPLPFAWSSSLSAGDDQKTRKPMRPMRRFGAAFALVASCHLFAKHDSGWALSEL